MNDVGSKLNNSATAPLFSGWRQTCISLLISPSTEINYETKWSYTEFPTNAAGFCREAWPLFLNEWKWPTLWACMNLNWVTKGILCNSVLFDLETAPLLIRGRTGDGCAHWALWGRMLQRQTSPAASLLPDSAPATRQVQQLKCN